MSERYIHACHTQLRCDSYHWYNFIFLSYQLRILTHIIQMMFTMARNKEAAGSDKNNFYVEQKQIQHFVGHNGDEETKNCNRHVITNEIDVRILTRHHFNTAS